MPAASRQYRHMLIAILVWVIAGLGLVLIGHARETTLPEPTVVTVVPVRGSVTGVLPGKSESTCPVPIRTC